MLGERPDLSVLEDRITISGATMAWDPDARIFEASYAPRARPQPADARGMLAWMDARAGSGGPFGLMVDLEHADHVSVAWRFRWMGWFYSHRKRMRVAIFHARRFDAMARHFARATGTTIDAYETAGEAREALQAWLAGAPDAPSPPPAPERI